MNYEMNVTLANELLNLRKLERAELKGIYVDAIINFDFYETSYKGSEFIILSPKKKDRYSPLQYANISKRLTHIIGKPIVFLFDNLVYYERNRMLKRGVYFIVSRKYAFLPFLIINSHTTESSRRSSLTPVAQYILLYHLQETSLDGKTYQEIERITPYKYITITRAIKLLKQLSLCELHRVVNNSITVHFIADNRVLWERALPYLINPVKEVWFCDKIRIDNELFVSSYNALAYYTSLNPDYTNMVAIEKENFKDIKNKNLLDGLNKIDGDTKIEVWEYTPISQKKVVDQLSLYITLKNDKDARVEKELEIMINKLW